MDSTEVSKMIISFILTLGLTAPLPLLVAIRAGRLLENPDLLSLEDQVENIALDVRFEGGNCPKTRENLCALLPYKTFEPRK
jgi:hypothetical protein